MLNTQNNFLVACATGLGKTVIFHEFLKQSSGKSLILFNRLELLKEQYDRAIKSGLDASIYSSSIDRNLNSNVVIGNVQSLSKVPANTFDRILIDEVHNVDFLNSKTQYAKFLNGFTGKIYGFTATPFRSNGFIYGKDKLFKQVDFSRGLKWAIDNGHLVPAVLKNSAAEFDLKNVRTTAGDYNQADLDKLSSDDKKVSKQLDDALPKLLSRQSIIWACCNIEHAERLNKMLTERGESSSVLHSEQEQDLRDSELKAFRQGQVRHLCFVSIVKEGFDCPRIDAVVLMRPTKSATLYVQIVGRGLRLFDNKKDCLVLDYGQVIKNLGALDAPFLSFAHKSSTKADVIEIAKKVCPGCYSYVDKHLKICQDCNHIFTNKFELNKNLTTKAYDGTFEQPEKVIENACERVTLSKHMSASGNVCLKVMYQVKDFFGDRYVSEFFIWNNEKSFRKAQLRLIQLSVPLKTDIDEQIKLSVLRTPRSVKYTFKKFYEVKELCF
jgi:DNA repair protein RadD